MVCVNHQYSLFPYMNILYYLLKRLLFSHKIVLSLVSKQLTKYMFIYLWTL